MNTLSKLIVGESIVDSPVANGPSRMAERKWPSAREARSVWGMIPLDCKRSMVALQQSGLMGVARADILREAEADLRRLGEPWLTLDFCWALEHAAQRWLREHGQSQIANSQREAA